MEIIKKEIQFFKSQHDYVDNLCLQTRHSMSYVLMTMIDICKERGISWEDIDPHADPPEFMR